MLEPIKIVIHDVNIEPVPRPHNKYKYPPILESSFEFEAPVTDDSALGIYKKEESEAGT